MSNERFSNPNGDAHDTDPQPERWADASTSDADALDALLNGIAQGNGFPNTRSSSGRGPDVRTDDGDAVLQTARRFHDRFEAAEVRDPGSSALDPHLWETIMTATMNPVPQSKQAHGRLWRDATRKAVPPGAATTPRSHQAVDRRSAQGWSGFANATLAVVILLAGFGVWRVYDGMNASGPADPEGTVPGLAMQPATPEPTELPAVVAPPVSTPAPSSACDFRADIPIFPGVDESPVEGTALLLTTTGELLLVCPEEPDPIVLASGIEQAGSGGWPGVVHASAGAGTSAFQAHYVNLVSGQVVEIGPYGSGQTLGTDDLIDSPWLVAPSAADPDQWQVTDLRTMESRLLVELMGAPWPDDTNILISESELGGTIAIAPYSPFALDLDQDPGGAIVQGGILPGDVLVLDGTLDETRWISLPTALPYREMLLSADGEHLALRGDTGELSATGPETVYSVVRTADGSEVGRSKPMPVSDHTLGMTWTQGGSALAFIQSSALMLIGTDGDGIPETLLDVDDGLGTVRPTYDPDVVTVRRVQAEEVATETPGLVQPRIYSVNTVTGDVMEFDGVAVRDMYGWAQPPARFLVLSDGYVESDDPVTYRVLDPVKREEYGTLPDVQLGELLGRPSLGVNSFVQSDDGNTEVIGFGAAQLYLTRWADDAAEIRQIDSLPGLAEAYNGSVELFLSPDGAMLSLTIDGDESRTRWLLPLDGEPDEWIEVPSTVPGEGPASIFFVPGTGE
ncbi:MAG: hypothetical protein WKF63_03345 [Thermomicrobiales bacterium]